MKCPTCDHDSNDTSAQLICHNRQLQRRVEELQSKRRDMFAAAALTGLVMAGWRSEDNVGEAFALADAALRSEQG